MSFGTILSSFFSGVLGAMGLGGGTILVVYLTLVLNAEQTAAQGINLLCFIPTAILSVIVYGKKGLIEKKTVFPLILFGLIGAGFGFFVLEKIPADFLGKLFGGFLIVLAIREFFNK